MSNAFPLVFAAGALASLLWLGLTDPISPPGRERTAPFARIDAGLLSLFTGLIGARLGYVIFHWGYFSTYPYRTLWLWEGGLSWAGGVLGALFGLGIYCHRSGQAFWALADDFAVPAALIGFAGWFGCLLDSCGYGKRADLGFLTPPASDSFGRTANRWPVQGFGAIAHVGLLLLMILTRGRKFRDGVLASLSLTIISVVHLALAFLRADPMPSISGLRIDGLASGGIMVISMTALAVRLWRR
jgi:phosphatidylglycerol:prolipoprotein diacylglycerol transferase